MLYRQTQRAVETKKQHTKQLGTVGQLSTENDKREAGGARGICARNGAQNKMLI